MGTALGGNIIELFCIFIQAIVDSLIFASKARSYTSGTPFRAPQYGEAAVLACVDWPV